MKKTKSTIGIKVPFFNAPKEFAFLKKKLHQALDQTGSSGQWILGPQVNKFEKTLSRKLKTKYVASCASGTDAIYLALKALSLGPKDEVILPANAYPSIFGVVMANVKPILVDVDPITANINPQRIKYSITKQTKAILVVHLYGQAANLSPIKKITKKHSIYLIEDCAQALGAKYNNRLVGSFGDIATYSFYLTKNLGALGDGGALTTNNHHLFTKIKILRMYGEKSRYDSRLPGINSRLDELQASFLLKKLSYVNQWIHHKRTLANIYAHYLKNINHITLPTQLPHHYHTYHLYAIKTSQRNKLQQHLSQNGIQTGIHYPKTIFQTKTFAHLGKNTDFPQACKWSRTTLSLPLNPFLSDQKIKFVSQKIINFFK